MTGFVPVSIDQFIRHYMHNNKTADGSAVRAGVEDALAAWRQGVRCACGNPLWVAGSAVAGYGCYTCITGSAQPDGDPEINQACEGISFEFEEAEDRFSRVNDIIRDHPRDYRERLEQIGYVWEEDDDDLLFEEEAREEGLAVPKSEDQQRLVDFFNSGGVVDDRVLEAYLEERYAEKPNLPLIRKYFKKANPHLKAILLKGLSRHPTDVDLLDDLAYFSEFDSMLGELICFYREACLLETDMERFSVLVQDFHLNTFEQGYDALHELSALFTTGEKGAVVRHLCTTINEYGRSEALPF